MKYIIDFTVNIFAEVYESELSDELRNCIQKHIANKFPGVDSIQHLNILTWQDPELSKRALEYVIGETRDMKKWAEGFKEEDNFRDPKMQKLGITKDKFKKIIDNLEAYKGVLGDSSKDTEAEAEAKAEAKIQEISNGRTPENAAKEVKDYTEGLMRASAALKCIYDMVGDPSKDEQRKLEKPERWANKLSTLIRGRTKDMPSFSKNVEVCFDDPKRVAEVIQSATEKKQQILWINIKALDAHGKIQKIELTRTKPTTPHSFIEVPHIYIGAPKQGMPDMEKITKKVLNAICRNMIALNVIKGEKNKTERKACDRENNAIREQYKEYLDKLSSEDQENYALLTVENLENTTKRNFWNNQTNCSIIDAFLQDNQIDNTLIGIFAVHSKVRMELADAIRANLVSGAKATDGEFLDVSKAGKTVKDRICYFRDNFVSSYHPQSVRHSQVEILTGKKCESGKSFGQNNCMLSAILLSEGHTEDEEIEIDGLEFGSDSCIAELKKFKDVVLDARKYLEDLAKEKRKDGDKEEFIREGDDWEELRAKGTNKEMLNPTGEAARELINYWFEKGIIADRRLRVYSHDGVNLMYTDIRLGESQVPEQKIYKLGDKLEDNSSRKVIYNEGRYHYYGLAPKPEPA